MNRRLRPLKQSAKKRGEAAAAMQNETSHCIPALKKCRPRGRCISRRHLKLFMVPKDRIREEDSLATGPVATLRTGAPRADVEEPGKGPERSELRDQARSGALRHSSGQRRRCLLSSSSSFLVSCICRKIVAASRPLLGFQPRVLHLCWTWGLMT